MQPTKETRIHIIGESSGETEASSYITDHRKTMLFHHAQRNTPQFITLTRPTW
jgi:hypothetical protein